VKTQRSASLLAHSKKRTHCGDRPTETKALLPAEKAFSEESQFRPRGGIRLENVNTNFANRKNEPNMGKMQRKQMPSAPSRALGERAPSEYFGRTQFQMEESACWGPPFRPELA